MTARSRGFTLPEIMVWMALVAVVASLASALIVFAGDSARRARKVHDDAAATVSVVEELGRDVRAATKRLDEVGFLKTGPTCLMLYLPGEGKVLWWTDGGIVRRESGTGLQRVTKPVGRVPDLTFEPAADGSRDIDAVIHGKSGDRRFRFFLMKEEGL